MFSGKLAHGFHLIQAICFLLSFYTVGAVDCGIDFNQYLSEDFVCSKPIGWCMYKILTKSRDGCLNKNDFFTEDIVS